MAEFRTRNEKRSILPYHDILALTGDTTLLCVDLGVLLILRGLVRDRGLWRSNYYKQLFSGGIYEIPTEAEFDQIDALVSGFLGDAEMSTCADLTALLQSIVSSNGSGCGCGAGGAGGTDAPPTTETGPTDIFAPTGDPPDPFTTWDEYRDYRCAVANVLLDDFTADIQWLQTVDLVALSAAGVAAGLLSPIPGDEIIALIALLVSAVGLGYAAAALQNLEDAILAVRDDLVCDLYTGSDLSTIASDFTATLETEVDNQTADPIERTLIKQIAAAWRPNDALNDLLVFDEKYNNAPYDQTDCATCQAICQVSTIHGNYLGGNQWEAVQVGSGPTLHWRVEIGLDCCADMEMTAISGWTAWVDPDIYIACQAVPVYSDANPPAIGADYCCDEWATRSNTYFTIDLQCSAGCTPC